MRGKAVDGGHAWESLRDRIAERLRPHASPDADIDWLIEAVLESRTLFAIVLSVDIRLSTLLMKEAVDLQRFAEVLSGFMADSQQTVFGSDGFFDKFTGDGFLAFWIPESLNTPDDDGDADAEEEPGLDPAWVDYLRSQLDEQPATSTDDTSTDTWFGAEASEYEEQILEEVGVALSAAAELLGQFYEVTLPQFRSQSRNLTSGVGLSIGIDFGELQLMPVARQFTVIGPPVVGAVRMVSAAKPWETLVNVYPGELLNRFPTRVPISVRVEQLYRGTKEYSSQEVYRVSFPRLALPTVDGEGQ